MKLTINIPDSLIEKIVRSIMDNYPEAGRGNSLSCVGWNYKKLEFDFTDAETGKEYSVNKAMLLKAFPLIFTDKWPKGCTPPPIKADSCEAWEDWLCAGDVTEIYAFLQLAVLGEVIYG